MHFCVVRGVGVLVEDADGDARRACEVCLCKDCMVIEEVEKIVFWFFDLEYCWAVGA